MYLRVILNCSESVLQLDALPGQYLASREGELRVEGVRQAEVQHAGLSELLVGTPHRLLGELSIESDVQGASTHSGIFVALSQEGHLVFQKVVRLRIQLL